MRRFRRRRVFREMDGRKAIAVLASVCILAISCLFWSKVNAALRPAIKTMALSGAVNRTTVVMEEAVQKCVVEHGFEYPDFISISKDDMGQITSMTSDLASVSLLKSSVAAYAADELEKLKEEQFGIPLGTLTGWIIFSGKGPTVRVDLLSVGDVKINVRHKFSDAGINQTLHQVFLDLSTVIHLMIPGEVLTESAKTTVCVAETIIVGKVPETYLYVGNGEVEHG